MISRFSSSKSKTLSALAACVMLAASASFALAQPAATQPAATQPTTAPAFPPITAVINGEPLPRDEFQRALEAVSGYKVFDEVLSFIVIQQACQNAGIIVGPDDFKAQQERLNQSLRDQGVPDKNLDQAIAMLIQRQGIAPFEFDLTLRIKTYLAAMSKGHGEVTQDQIDQAYKVSTGNRYVIVDSLLPDPSMAADFRKLIEKDKKSVTDAGNELHIHQQTLTVSEFADDKSFPKVILDYAKKLKEGELSPMAPLENGNHMVYLKKIIPPAQVSPSEVPAYKAKLKAELSQSMEDQWGQQQLAKLRQTARVEIHDPALLGIYQQIQAYQAKQAAAAAAATQSATPPAPAVPAPK